MNDAFLDLDALAEAVADKLAARLRQPHDDDLMTADQVAEYLHLANGRSVLERRAKSDPDFPLPYRPATASGKSKSLWFRADIVQYARRRAAALRQRDPSH